MVKSVTTFEVGDLSFQSGRLSVFDQMVVAKRLMPVLKNIVTPEIIGLAMSAQTTPVEAEGTQSDDASKVKIDVASILPAVADAIYSLSDADLQVIIKTTLSVVSRRNQGGAYSQLLVNGVFMFDDLSLSQTLQVAWKVIESHLGDFFTTAP